MPIEIEKKYKLTQGQRRAIERRMREMSLVSGQVEHEENTLYRGGSLDQPGRALRLRRVNGRAMLTFKQRRPGSSPIKHQEEHEVSVADADAMEQILAKLNYRPGLVYEKRRARWKVGQAKVVIDELPFGLFMEIEAPVREIKRVEKIIGAADLPVVMETYPGLTRVLGKEKRGVIEARFVPRTRRSRKTSKSRRVKHR